MKRYNLVQARGAEFSCGTEGIAVEGEGNDVIELNVLRGKVNMIVPATLRDDQVCVECFKYHTCLDIELENGAHITGWVRSGESHLELERPSPGIKRQTKTPRRRRVEPTLVRHRLLKRFTPTE